MGQLVDTQLVILLVAGTFVVFVSRPLWHVWNVYAGASTRRQFDSSTLGLQPPPDLLPDLSELMRLGFTRLGEAQLDVPGIRAVALKATNDPHGRGGMRDRHTVFAFVESDATVTAETAVFRGAPTLMTFSTIFADGSVVETMYPRGESIHDPDFHSGHNKESMAGAYAEQRAEIERWRMHHGSPRLISNMTDYLRADAEYRERFAKRKLWRPLLRNQLLPIVVTIGALLVLLAFALDLWPG